ncbi:MAG: alpha/beta fold hydrolase, partial [Anaerolineae bacterium]|nr:alpha/beta fold hydrolase [Anaerolineae bacterium]
MMLIKGMAYYVDMKGNGMPLLLLHGFTGSSQNWASQLEFFSQQFLTLAPDLPGHGKTDSSRYSIEHTAEDMVTLLKSVTQEPAHLVGYSMGGRLALYLALTYPQHFRSLILESASPGLESPEARLERRMSDEQLALRIEQNGIQNFVDYWEQLPLFESQKNLPEQIRQNLKNQRLNNNPVGLMNSLRGMGT